MANSIYLTTHDGLTRLVSARVASKALSAALREQGSSPDTISYQQMKVILLGPVRKEFASILPPAGLERSLTQLVKTLEALPTPKPVPVGLSSEDTADRNRATEGTERKKNSGAKANLSERDARIFQTLAFVESPGPETSSAPLEGVRVESASPAAVLARELIKEEEADAPDIAAEPELAEAVEVEADEVEAESVEGKVVDAESTETSTAPPAAPAPTEPVQKISQERLEGAALEFAQLEYVKLVAAFDNKGESVFSRGSGFDLAALSRLSGMAMKLLGKSGVLRSYYLAHSEGQLFLFPHGGYTLMVIGNTELNLGLVFTTLQKLKEEM